MESALLVGKAFALDEWTDVNVPPAPLWPLLSTPPDDRQQTCIGSRESRRLLDQARCPTRRRGLSWLDGVTGGGLPRWRSALVCGPARRGKTLLAMEFPVRGITEYGEPGPFVA